MKHFEEYFLQVSDYTGAIGMGSGINRTLAKIYEHQKGCLGDENTGNSPVSAYRKIRFSYSLSSWPDYRVQGRR
jgi:hypothetical protein